MDSTPQESSEKAGKKTVSVFKLFRYATTLDIILIMLGSIAGVLNGSAFPIAMLIFGRITNAFINRETTAALIQQDVAFCTPDLSEPGIIPILNFTDLIGDPNCNDVYSYTDLTGATCSNFSLMSTLVLASGNMTECLTDDLFINELNLHVYSLLGITLGAFIFGFFQTWFFNLAAERQIIRIKRQYYKAVLRQDLAWFDMNATGSISGNLSIGVEKIYAAIGDNIAIVIQWNSTFLAAFVVGLIIEYRLALLLLAVMPLLAIVAYLIGKVGGYFSGLEQKNYASAGNAAQEALSSIKTVQTFGGEDHEYQRYDKYLKSSVAEGVYKGMAVGASIGSVYFLIYFVYSISFWFGGYLVSEQLTQVGDIITVFFSILIGAFYFGQSGPNLQKVAEAQAAATPIYDIIDRKPPIDSSSNDGIIPEDFHPDIELKNVNFTFPSRPKNQVLKDFSLNISSGEKLALVGGSGSGKSTVIKLIQRLYDVNSGEVYLGGINVKDLNLKWLRSQIGVVSQEPVLFDTTIAENIRYGKEGASMDDIIEAAKQANAHDFIVALPDGYETDVHEGGSQLSGGEKQRVAIARALIRNPKILLLDEATSALDTNSEKLVQEALDNACKDRTTITIAHRLSTIKDSHLIASLDGGKVTEIGTHAQLIGEHGIYYDLVVAQSFASAPTKSQRDSKVLMTSHSVRKRRSQRKEKSPSRRLRSATLRQKQTSGAERSIGTRARSKSTAVINFNKKSPENPNVSIASVADDKLNGDAKIDEENSKPHSVSFFRLLRINTKALPAVFIGCVAAMINGAVFPAFAIVFGEALKVFVRPPDEILSGIHPWAAAFLGIGIVSAIASFVKFVCFNISGTRLSQVVRSTLYRALLKQEKDWYDLEENSTNALSTKLAIDAGLIQGMVGIRIGSALESVLALLLSLAIAFGYSWLTALVVLAFLPVMVLAGLLHFSLSTGNVHQSQKALRASTEVVIESVENIQTVTAFGLEEYYYKNFLELVEEPYRKSLWLAGLFATTYSLSQSVIFFGYIITYRFGAFQVTQPTDSVVHTNFEDVYRVFAAIVFGGIGIASVFTFAPDANKAQDAAKTVFEIIDRASMIDGTSERGDKPDTILGNVQFRNVTFSYKSRPDAKVLGRLNLTGCSENKTLALVGGSGSGKSTVLSLINRLYDPSLGSVHLDGHNLKNLNVKWLRSKIGVVSQEPVLFDASIADNIRYGSLFKEVTDEEVVSAAQVANIHSFIQTLPQGYDTNVGAKGTQLSGGQKQRIAIARAMIRDPKILLLDEATSALDTESENIIQEALDKAREGRTTIIVAHRLSTIRNADLIAVLKDGHLKEVGTHDQLMANADGLYYGMVYTKSKAWRRDSELSHLNAPKSTATTF